MSALGALREILAARFVKGGASSAERALANGEAARLQRARRMGFDVERPLYHGTAYDVPAFEVGRGSTHGVGGEDAVFLTELTSEAGHYANRSALARSLREHGEYDGITGANVLPVYIKPGRQLDVDFGDYDPKAMKRVIDRARRQGYDSVRLRNVGEPGRDPLYPRVVADQIAVLRPRNIRSRFAAFDPARSNSSDLLAGLAIGVPAGGLTLREVLRDQYGERA